MCRLHRRTLHLTGRQGPVSSKRDGRRPGRRAPVSPRAKPWQAAPAGEKRRRASGAARSLLRSQSLKSVNARIIHNSFLENVAGADLSKWNIASFSKDEQDKVSVDKAAAAVAWQERMNKPVVHELVEREQPEHLREYFRERLRVHRLNSQQLPRANAPEYQKPEDGGSESKP